MSLREALSRLLGREKAARDQPNPLQAYTFFWMKEARQWSERRRAAVSLELEELMRGANFEANLYERRYSLPALEEGRHAGASLLALSRVLQALDQHGSEVEQP